MCVVPRSKAQGRTLADRQIRKGINLVVFVKRALVIEGGAANA